MIQERFLAVTAAVLGLVIAGLALFWHPAPPERPLPRAALAKGGDFTLQSAAGPVSLSDFRGKLVLLYFGYTYCPDICPTALAATAEGLKQLTPDELASVATIFISVDPERDTPSRLKEYAEFFHPAILGVTGTSDMLADIAQRYGVFYTRQNVATAGDGYVVDHTSDTYVINATGTVVGKIAHATPPDQVAEAIRKYLDQP